MLKNRVWFGIILSILLLLFSINGSAYDYTYTQQSGAGFFVSTADKSDAIEDTCELRQIVNDLGTLLQHSKMDGSYPADSTTGGTLGIFDNYYLKTEIDSQGEMETIWGVTLLNDITGESMGDLSDVDLTDIANGKILKYNSTSAKWECENESGGGYTNLTSFVDQTAWRLFYSNTAGDVTELALGANGTYLKSNGATSAPTFATPASGVDTSGTPEANDIARFTDANTIEGLSYAELKAALDLEIGTDIQAYDAGLTSLAGLTYASPSFIKVTANDTYAIRTIAETKTDLSLNLVENTALSTWAGTANIITLGTIGTGTWQGTAIADTYIPNDITIDLATTVTTNANLTGDVTSTGNATDINESVLAVGGTDTIFPADPNADRYLFWDDDPGELTWAEGAGGGVTTFTGLTDTPANYTGSANKFVQVNGTPDALIFDTISSDDLSDVASIAMLDEAEDIAGAWTVSGSIEGVDATEFSYLDGVTSDIQDQFGLRYLKTEIDTQGEVETIWGDTLMNDLVDDTTPQLGGNEDAQDYNITGAGSISFTQELDNGSKTANFSVDFSTDQNQKATLTANTMTLTLDTTSVGVGHYSLKLVNGGLATLTWASESGSVYFPGGTDPSLTSSGTDIVSFQFDGTNWYGVASLDFK